jgi:hypothetical protein
MATGDSDKVVCVGIHAMAASGCSSFSYKIVIFICLFCLYVSIFQTYIGPVLVSVNPYHELDIYNAEVMKSYKNVNFYELPPHV